MKSLIYNLISAIVIGVLLGLFAKIADSRAVSHIIPILSFIGGRLGIWIFTATLLSVSCKSPIIAALRILVFFLAMLAVYYSYTVLLLGFNPRKYIVFWGICAFISPICAFAIWFVNKGGLIANIGTATVVSLLFAEVYIISQIDYLTYQSYVFYGIMIIILLLRLSNTIKQCMASIGISVFMCAFIIYFDLINIIFGNWMM